MTAIANQQVWLAIAWHIIVAGVLVTLATGWRPSHPTARTLVAAPLVFGVVRLGVALDAGLIAGAVVLAAAAPKRYPRRSLHQRSTP